MTIEPSGYEATTAFMVRYLAGDRVKRRIALVSRGHWEVMSAMGILFAANMLRTQRRGGKDALRSRGIWKVHQKN